MLPSSIVPSFSFFFFHQLPVHPNLRNRMVVVSPRRLEVSDVVLMGKYGSYISHPPHIPQTPPPLFPINLRHRLGRRQTQIPGVKSTSVSSSPCSASASASSLKLFPIVSITARTKLELYLIQPRGGGGEGKEEVLTGDERGSIVGLASLSALGGVCIVYSRTHDHGTGWIRRQKKTATNPPWSG